MVARNRGGPDHDKCYLSPSDEAISNSLLNPLEVEWQAKAAEAISIFNIKRRGACQ